MDPDYAQRRRIAIAAAITIIVLPAFVLLTRGDDGDANTSDPAVGTVPEQDAQPIVADATTPTDEAPSDDVIDDVMGELSPGFVTGESSGGDSDIPTIVYPRPVESVDVSARFDRTIGDIDRCYVPNAPFNSFVTITNVDNGQLVGCYNSLTPSMFPDEELAVLHTDAFAAIADLTDSPVPVEVTW